jgi:hypothetical protein
MTNESTSFISAILGPYHRNTVARVDKRYGRVILLSKVVRTPVHMPESSRRTVHSQFSRPVSTSGPAKIFDR